MFAALLQRRPRVCHLLPEAWIAGGVMASSSSSSLMLLEEASLGGSRVRREGGEGERDWERVLLGDTLGE